MERSEDEQASSEPALDMGRTGRLQKPWDGFPARKGLVRLWAETLLCQGHKRKELVEGEAAGREPREGASF